MFARLGEYGVQINPAKCVFGTRQIKFLKYLVSAESTRPLPEKVKTIQDLSKPDAIRQLRQFLGTINFYKRFIPKAARVQATLNEALKGPERKEKNRCLDIRDETSFRQM